MRIWYVLPKLRNWNRGNPLRFPDLSRRADCPSAVDTRWVLTWEIVDGANTVEARVVAKGFQDPDLKGGVADSACCVSLRSSHLQVISLGALNKWGIWILGTKNAFLQADDFSRDVFLPAPNEWEPSNTSRIWELRAPAYGLNDAPLTFYRSTQNYLVNSDVSLSKVGL